MGALLNFSVRYYLYMMVCQHGVDMGISLRLAPDRAQLCRYPGMQQDCSSAAMELQAILGQALSSRSFGHEASGFSPPSRSANPICRDESFASRSWSQCGRGDIDRPLVSPSKPTKRPGVDMGFLAASPPSSHAGRLSPSCSRWQLHVSPSVN